ncbi:MAG: hypothetical protein LBN34_08990 [Clostridiales Family XIII bacterium]|jgi:hypothetical protein|nr:hypothetical protein [Clostridiales Family XIII bacterium]
MRNLLTKWLTPHSKEMKFVYKLENHPWAQLCIDFLIIFVIYIGISWGLFTLAYSLRNDDTFITVTGEINGDYKIGYHDFRGELIPNDGHNSSILLCKDDINNISLINKVYYIGGVFPAYSIETTAGVGSSIYNSSLEEFELRIDGEEVEGLRPVYTSEPTAVDIEVLQDKFSLGLKATDGLIYYKTSVCNIQSDKVIYISNASDRDNFNDWPVGIKLESPDMFEIDANYQYSDSISTAEKNELINNDDGKQIYFNKIGDTYDKLPLLNVNIRAKNINETKERNFLTIENLRYLKINARTAELSGNVAGCISLENIESQNIEGSGEIYIWQSSTPTIIKFDRQSLLMEQGKALHTDLIFDWENIRYTTEGYVKNIKLEKFSLKPSFTNWYTDNTMTLVLSLFGLFGTTIATIGILDKKKEHARGWR